MGYPEGKAAIVVLHSTKEADKVRQIDGTVVSASEFEMLEVAVMTLDVTDPAGRAVHRDVTSDKVGGRVPGQKNYII